MGTKKNDLIMKYADRTWTASFAVSFLLIAVLQARASFILLGKHLLCTAIPFMLVTLMRHFFAKKRPYQGTTAEPPRRGENDSFPSRHAFSAFLIAMTAFSVNTPFAYALLPLALLLSTVRVFRGIHYPADVVAGGFLGVFFGTIYLIVI